MEIGLGVCKGADTLKAHLRVDHTPMQLCAHRQRTCTYCYITACPSLEGHDFMTSQPSPLATGHSIRDQACLNDTTRRQLLIVHHLHNRCTIA